jgi:hypothetical protein
MAGLGSLNTDFLTRMSFFSDLPDVLRRSVTCKQMPGEMEVYWSIRKGEWDKTEKASV